ncbi:MAG: ParB/RepB/Spo0J family partition protein [Planctomycetaceae bacterium]|nr:ParB/RepB/Spo0J family partition protein [Planctomycetaceae bacterium]
MAATATETDTNLNFELIEIENLQPSKTNTRTTFEKEDLSKLAASIKQHGILQPLVVRVCADDADRFEIIAGERRFRAGKQAKLKLIPCRIVECDDVEAVEIQASENLDRVDLNPIEEAYTWQKLLDVTGLTQTKLAARFKRSQAHIANHLRLLKLPEEWQQKIVNEEIPATFGRDLASWAKYPQVFEQLPDTIQEVKERYADGYELGLSDFREALEDALHAVTVSMHQAKFSVTDELKKELQVELFDNAFGAKIERAFNTDRFRELQDKAEAEQKKFMESKGSGSKGAKNKGTLFDVDEEGDGGVTVGEYRVKDTRSPAEIEADIKHAEMQGQKKRKELLDRKYADWKCAWYQEAIGVQLDHRKPTDGFLFKLLLFYSVTMDIGVNDLRSDRLRESVKTWGGKVRGERYRMKSFLWDGLTSIQAGSKELAATTLAKYIRIPIEHNAFSHEQIGEIAKELGIDIEKEWKLTEDFLQLHTKPQLIELAKEWKFPQDGLEEMKREALVQAILEMESQLRLEFDKKKDSKQQPAQAPKALVKAKLPN